jgi:hypothetical protein
MHKSRQAIDQQQAALMGYDRLTDNRISSFDGKKREKPVKFTGVNAAVEKFKVELFKTLKISQISEWLSKRLK